VTMQLVLKELPLPLRLILTNIVKKRLIKGHSKHSIIEKDLAKRWAGYWGEFALSNYLKELPQEKHFIFYDLQLKHNGVHFQIDALLISRTHILIIEAKNIIGILQFDNVFKQLIRINNDGSEESFEDPRVQGQRLQSLLRGWMRSNGYDFMPVDYLVFFKSATNTILKTNSNDKTDLNKVCKGRDLFNKIHALEQRFKKELIDMETLNHIGKLLLSHHSPKEIKILEEYKLTGKDIHNGVCCPNEKCLHTPMEYKKGNWVCSKCLLTSKDAHIDALSDYYYLIKPTITNSELRIFLHLPTSDTAQKILQRLKLQVTGKTRDRIYHLRPNEVPLCVL
jgi:hypothetical protein